MYWRDTRQKRSGIAQLRRMGAFGSMGSRCLGILNILWRRNEVDRFDLDEGQQLRGVVGMSCGSGVCMFVACG